MKYRKILAISIILMLVLVALPATEALQKTKSLECTVNQTLEETLSTIILIKYSADGSIKQSTKYVTSITSMNLIDSIRCEDAESPEILFESIPSEKTFVRDSIDIPSNGCLTKGAFQQLLRNTNRDKINNYNSIFNAICRLNVKMLGLGFVLGTHSVPIANLLPGVDFIGVFAGLGSIDVTGGIMDDEHKSGIVLGGFLGFTGTILFVIIPMLAGPIIYINGFSLFTLWM